jgi:hypothetical protein
MKDISPRAVDDKASGVASLAQFYAAEYSALMGRISLWTTLQYSLWPIILLIFAVLAQLKDILSPTLLAWTTGLVIPVGYIAFQSAMIDALESVLLLESKLRPLAARLTGTGTELFWIHERFHRKKRKANPAFWAYWPPVVSFAWPLAVFIYLSWCRGTKPIDFAGLAVSFLPAGFVLFLTWRGIGIEAEIEKAVQHGEWVG